MVDPFVCQPSGTTLCVRNGRFQIDVEWEDFSGNRGVGTSVPLDSDESALYWFFNDANYELLVKVLDGCDLTGEYWIFAAASTNVEYKLTVIDSLTGLGKFYFNPLGTTSRALTDSQALAACP